MRFLNCLSESFSQHCLGVCANLKCCFKTELELLPKPNLSTQFYFKWWHDKCKFVYTVVLRVTPRTTNFTPNLTQDHPVQTWEEVLLHTWLVWKRLYALHWSFKLTWVVALAPSVWFSLVIQNSRVMHYGLTVASPVYSSAPYMGSFKVGSLTCVLAHGDTGCYGDNSTQKPSFLVQQILQKVSVSTGHSCKHFLIWVTACVLTATFAHRPNTCLWMVKVSEC